MADIVLHPNKLLHEKTKPVDKIDSKILRVVDELVETMYFNRGVGLSAPQIGILLSLFVYDSSGGDEKDTLRIVINPKIISYKGEQDSEEGCLSIPGFVLRVKRSRSIQVRYQDIFGYWVEEQLDGLEAAIFQHEYDHLFGITLLNRASPIKRKYYLPRK